MKCNCGNDERFFKENKKTNIGIYCEDCGKWQKWASRDECCLYSYKKENTNTDYRAIQEDSIELKKIKQNLKSFVDFLEIQIDKELTRFPVSKEDALVKCSVALSYEKDKHAILNILEGKGWDNNN